jgi:hypothetical protein
MQKLIQLSLFWCLLGVAPAHAEDETPSVATQIMARAYVPNRTIPQGEVRLVQRDGAAVVQSVLHTRFGKLAKKRITDKELKNWGDHRDATSYISAVEDAFNEYEKCRSAEGNQMALVIDFVDGPVSARVEFSFVHVSREKHGFDIRPSTIWRSLPVTRDYLRKDQEYILADAFQEDSDEPLDCLRRFRTGPESRPHE